MVTSNAVELDSFGENDDNAERTAERRGSFAGSQDGAGEMASSQLDDGVMDRLDDFVQFYQSMKRRKKMMMMK